MNINIFIVLLVILFSYTANAQLKTVVQFGHEAPITELAYSEDGKILASTDGITIKLWDVSTCMEFKTLYVGEGRIYPITDLDFVRTSIPYTLSYLCDQKIIYQNALTDEILEISHLKKNKDTISAEEKLNLKFSERDVDSTQMKKYFKKLNVLNQKGTERWREMKNLPNYKALVHNENGDIRLTKNYGQYSSKEVKRLKKNKSKAEKLNRQLAHVNKKRTRNGLSALNKLPIPYVPHAGEAKTIIEVSSIANNKLLLTLSIDKTIYPIPRASNQAYTIPMKGNKSSVSPPFASLGVNISPDGKIAVVGRQVYNLVVNNKKDKRIIGRLDIPADSKITCAEFSYDGKQLITGVAGKDTKFPDLIVWDINNFSTQKNSKKAVDLADTIPAFYQHYKIECTPVVKIIMVADANYFITFHTDHTLRYWNLNTGKEDTALFTKFNSSKIINDIQNISAIAISKNKQSLVTGSSTVTNPNTAIHIWDVTTGSLAKELGARIAPVKFTALGLNIDHLLSKEWESLKDISKPGLFRISQQKDQTIGLRNVKLAECEIKSIAFNNDVLYSPDWSFFLKHANDSSSVSIGYLGANDTLKLLEKSEKFCEFSFGTNSNFVAGVRNNNIQIWQVSSGKLAYKTTAIDSVVGISLAEFDSVLIFITDNKVLYRWQFSEPNKIDSFKIKDQDLKDVLIKGKGYLEVGSDLQGKFNQLKRAPRTFDPHTFENVKEDHNKLQNGSLKSPFDYSKSQTCSISPDGKRSVVWLSNGYGMGYYNFAANKQPVKPDYFSVASLMFKQTGKRLVYNIIANDFASTDTTENKSAEEIYINTAKQIMLENLKSTLDHECLERYSCINSEWTYFARTTKTGGRKRKIKVTDLTSHRTYTLKDKIVPVEYPYLSPSGRYLASSSEGDQYQVIRLWDVKKEALIKTFVGHSGTLIFSDDEKTLISSGIDRQIKVWDVEAKGSVVGKPLLSIVAIKGTDDYIMYTPEGYYMTTKANTQAIAFQFQDKAYPFEQFDLKFNRPDIVVEALSKLTKYSDTSIVNLYHKAYLKRIDKMQLDVKTIESFESTTPPLAIIVNKENLLDKDTSGQFKINIELTSRNGAALKQLDVYDNGVPVYGSKGKIIDGITYAATISIPLSEGINKIQLKCTDTRGLQSLYETHIVNYAPTVKQKKKIYLVNIGLAQYKKGYFDQTNIKNDMNAWRLQFKGTPIIEKNLFDSKATYTQIKEIKSELLKTNVDDEVIIFYEGHGAQNDTMTVLTTYYFGTTKGTDEKGSFDARELEELLDSIPARNKLLMINACYSGDKDKDTIVFRKLRDLFINLARDNGSSIIVSSEGLKTSGMIDSLDKEKSIFGSLLIKALNQNKDGLRVYDLAKSIEAGLHESQFPYAKVINMDANFIIKKHVANEGNAKKSD